MKDLEIFVNRLKKIGIEIELAGNFPWIYLNKVNGKRVTDLQYANHGFTICFYPKKTNEKIEFKNLSNTFKVIRKYINE